MFQNDFLRPEHRKKTHKFWWDNKAEPKFRDKVIIKEEDSERYAAESKASLAIKVVVSIAVCLFLRFKDEVKKALESFVEKEDEFIKQVIQQPILMTPDQMAF